MRQNMKAETMGSQKITQLRCYKLCTSAIPRAVFLNRSEMPRNCTCLIFSRCENGICTWVNPCLVCWNAAVMSLDFLPGSLCWNTWGYLDVMGDLDSLTRFISGKFHYYSSWIWEQSCCSCYGAPTGACIRLDIP